MIRNTILYILLYSTTAYASPIDCTVDNDTKTVTIKMSTPHPNHALIYQPDGTVVWLQSGPEYIHPQLKDFSHVAVYEITQESVGTVWNDGGAAIEKVISGSGRYHFYVADNIETEPENTYYMECFFTID